MRPENHPTARSLSGAAGLEEPRMWSLRLLIAAIPTFLFISLAGCSLWASEEVADPAPVEESRPVEEPQPEEPEPESAPLTLLEQAELHFEEGRYEWAESLFVRYLESHEARTDGQRDRALWGLAMVNLLPDSPMQDRERAMVALDRLAEAHGETVRGAQARWVRSLLAELEQIRAQVDEQERLLIQLTETVEQLRRIDLNRRPSTPSRPLPDTVPRLR
jgi:hypothetical protein